jgi:single-strand DNA-binding protein
VWGALQLGRGPVRASHEGNRSGPAYGAKPQRTSLSLTKGTRVIVSGRLKSRSYETKEGEKHTVTELEVDEIGASLRYANAKVNRTQRSNGTGQAGGGFGNSNTAATAPRTIRGPPRKPRAAADTEPPF